MNIKHVLAVAPPTPACFPDRLQWSEFLWSAQKEKQGAPFKGGIYRPAFNFCRGCTQAHAAAMTQAGKCNPNKFLATELNRELA